MLARKLTWQQAVAVREELAESDLSLADLVLMRIKERLGLLYVVEGARGWGAAILDAIALKIERGLGLSTRQHPRQHARTPEPKEPSSTYHSNLAAYPTADTLRVLRRDLRAAGVHVLFYVAPVAPRRLEESGVAPEEFAARIDALREARRRHPRRVARSARSASD